MNQDNEDRIVSYRGRPIESLTRDELLEVLNEMARQLRQQRREAAHDRDFLLDCMR